MRRLLVLVGLVLATVAIPAGRVQADVLPPPTLSGELLKGTPTLSVTSCQGASNNQLEYTVSGVATGSYSGTFTEHGSIQPDGDFAASFTLITSDGITVTGTKHYNQSGPTPILNCYPDTDGSINILYVLYLPGTVSYTATIHTQTGVYHDEGTSMMTMVYVADIEFLDFHETYTSSLTETVLLTPTSKEQCKNGGYETFIDPSTGQPFKNQGQCIQFVNTGK